MNKMNKARKSNKISKHRHMPQDMTRKYKKHRAGTATVDKWPIPRPADVSPRRWIHRSSFSIRHAQSTSLDLRSSFFCESLQLVWSDSPDFQSIAKHSKVPKPTKIRSEKPRGKPEKFHSQIARSLEVPARQRSAGQRISEDLSQRIPRHSDQSAHQK